MGSGDAADAQSAAMPNGAAAAAMLAQCYDSIRGIARALLAQNRMRFVFQPTDLANEASMRLIRAELAGVDSEGRLLAIAARTMRNIIIDEARKAAAAKRNALPPELVTLWPGEPSAEPMDLISLDEALGALARLSPERAEVVELRFMLGLTVEECAKATGMAERTVKRHWQAARAWLIAYYNGQID